MLGARGSVCVQIAMTGGNANHTQAIQAGYGNKGTQTQK